MRNTTKFDMLRYKHILSIYCARNQLNPFRPNFPFGSTWKHQITKDFQMFSRESKRNIGKKRIKHTWHWRWKHTCLKKIKYMYMASSFWFVLVHWKSNILLIYLFSFISSSLWCVASHQYQKVFHSLPEVCHFLSGDMEGGG